MIHNSSDCCNLIISRYKHHQSHSTGITDSHLEHHLYTSRTSLLVAHCREAARYNS